MCTDHVQFTENALYPMSAFTFLTQDDDFPLYKARRKRAEAVEKALKGLMKALDREKEAAVTSLQREKQRMMQLVGFAYEEMTWKLTHTVAEMTLFLDNYITEVQNYTKNQGCLLSTDIISLAEADLDTILAFSMRNAACDVVKTVLSSAEWRAEVSLSPSLPSFPCCDCEPLLERWLLHGYGQTAGGEKVEGLVKAAEESEREGRRERAEELYGRAAVIAEIYSPSQAAKCWLLLSKPSSNPHKPKAQHCFLQAFALLRRLPMDRSSFSLLQFIGKLGLRVKEVGPAVATLELAISLPALTADQRFVGLLALLTALGTQGEGWQYVSRLESALLLFPAPDNQISLLISLIKRLSKANKCTEAAETLRIAVSLGSDYLSKDFNSANALFHGISDYNCLLSPHSRPIYLQNLGKIQLKLNDLSNAYGTWAELHALTAFSNEKIAVLLGKLCLELRKRSEGIRMLQRTDQELRKQRKEPGEQLKTIIQRLEMSPP